jgi:hypothetical protein
MTGHDHATRRRHRKREDLGGSGITSGIGTNGRTLRAALCALRPLACRRGREDGGAVPGHQSHPSRRTARSHRPRLQRAALNESPKMEQRQEEYQPIRPQDSPGATGGSGPNQRRLPFLTVSLISRVCWRGECNTPPVGNVLHPRLTTKLCDGKMGLAGWRELGKRLSLQSHVSS